MTKIAVFVGSLRADSLNKKLAENLEVLAPEDVEFDYIDLNLPLYNQEYDGNYPAEAQRVKEQVEAADGVLFVTPEYNRSIPGVLKNAIDWASRPWGTNSFKHKPTGIVGASTGPIGTAVAQSHLRGVCGFLDVKFMSQPELYFGEATDRFDGNGSVTGESREYLKRYIETFTRWVRNEENIPA